MPPVRRLTAILAADVVGYSRLMGADEEGTHERLKAHRRELVDPKINEHSGRIVKTTGDGMLAEFPSVVGAVRCAAEVQRAMIDREARIPEDRRIKFRVGINVGDIIVDDDDIIGESVNVAARAEALSDPEFCYRPCYFKWPARCLFISNMVTLSLPKTLRSLSSARISRRFPGFCRLCERIYSHILLTT
jgi:class 3 adenylate cyclase